MFARFFCSFFALSFHRWTRFFCWSKCRIVLQYVKICVKWVEYVKVFFAKTPDNWTTTNDQLTYGTEWDFRFCCWLLLLLIQTFFNITLNWHPITIQIGSHIFWHFSKPTTPNQLIEHGNSVSKVALDRDSLSFYQFFRIFPFKKYVENSSIHFSFRVNLFLITETTLESIKFEATIACRLQHTNQSRFVNKFSNNSSSISNLPTTDSIHSAMVQIPVHIFERRDHFSGALKIEKYCWYMVHYCALETKCKRGREWSRY